MKQPLSVKLVSFIRKNWLVFGTVQMGEGSEEGQGKGQRDVDVAVEGQEQRRGTVGCLDLISTSLPFCPSDKSTSSTKKLIVSSGGSMQHVTMDLNI
jgi:hypothetical protein